MKSTTMDLLKPTAHSILYFSLVAFFVSGSLARAQGIESAKPDVAQIDKILRDNCVRCHGPETQKRDLRLDQLNRDFASGGDADRWHEVLNQVATGDMPPPKEKPLLSQQRQTLTTWLRAGLESAALAKRTAQGAVTLRRLSREEYQHTMEDLLGLQIDFTSELPPDPPSKDGFLNNGETLPMSESQLEAYLAIAQRALDLSFDTRSATKPLYYFVPALEMRDLHIGRKLKKAGDGPIGYEPNTTTRTKNPALPLTPMKLEPFNAAQASKAKSFAPITIEPGYRQGYGLPEWPMNGELLVHVRAAGGGGNAAMTVSMGFQASVEVLNLKPVGSALVGKEEVFEFRVRMDSIPLVPANGKNKFKMELLFISNDSLTANLLLDSVEVSTVSPTPATQHPFLAETPAATLRKLLPKAWRRPVSEQEIQRLVALHDKLAQTARTTALRDTLAVVLSSANFLYLIEPRAAGASAALTEHELAARLSYFLWNTMPDDELRRLADTGQLRKQLDAQFTRLLNDKRSDRFVRSFVYQWLDLNALERVAVNPEYFSDYTDDLKADSARETYAFFDYILRHDLPATNFIKSDFVTVNDRLADHYGIPNISGSEFRPVPAPAHRGGLSTQASILTANANGVDSHPIKRGTWILLRLLNDPPPSPPPNVPMLDEAKAQAQGLSIAQQLAEHRNNAACADCHQKIDSWGLALENFNAIGLWRDDPTKATILATQPSKKKAAKKGAPEKATEASAEGNRSVTGKPALVAFNTPVEALQQRLLTERGDDFARAFVSKLLTYALGRSLDFADTKAVDELTADFKANKFNIRHLMNQIVASNTFQRRS